jgi:hypothetical protein
LFSDLPETTRIGPVRKNLPAKLSLDKITNIEGSNLNFPTRTS